MLRDLKLALSSFGRLAIFLNRACWQHLTQASKLPDWKGNQNIMILRTNVVSLSRQHVSIHVHFNGNKRRPLFFAHFFDQIVV